MYHWAGLGGSGGSLEPDRVIYRDRDANNYDEEEERGGWPAASDSTAEERTYFCQNFRTDVGAIFGPEGYSSRAGDPEASGRGALGARGCGRAGPLGFKGEVRGDLHPSPAGCSRPVPSSNDCVPSPWPS